MNLFLIFGFLLVINKAPEIDASEPCLVVEPEYVKLMLYNEKNDHGTAILNPRNFISGVIFIVIHGWSEDGSHRWVTDAKNALLHKYPDSNVITVDYKKYGLDTKYNDTWCAAPKIGIVLAEKIRRLQLPIDRIVVIGFSIGAQITGVLARSIKENGPKIPLVIALDAAGVGFDPAKLQPFASPRHTYLKCGDAEKIVGLYSSRETLGMKTMYADINIIVNDGSNQDVCPVVADCPDETKKECQFCPHIYARETFINAIPMAPEYTARKCVNFDSYDSCSGNTEYVIQALQAPIKKFGKYFIKIDRNYQQIA